MTSASGFRYIPALDGVRAIAVLAVLLYHADLSAVSGGFLGVETFFVVSGFLITSLLMHEHEHDGRTDILGFWLRRARRLFPALWLLLIVVPTYAALRLPEELYGLRRDLMSALLYVTNWQLIWAHESYFEQMGRPSLLKHLWSLAVEEQFYLLWPLFFAQVLTRLKRPHVIPALLGLSVLSAGWMALLHDPGVDPSRVYYGSDTRAFGILLGATLAFALPTLQSPLARFATPLASFGIFGLLLAFGMCDELSSWVYPWGLLLVDVSTLALIAGVVLAPAGLLGRLFSAPAIVFVGKRSYSLYLWHWPLFTVTRPELDLQMSSGANLMLRLLLTFVLAELSYRLVELPIRNGALSRAWRALVQGGHKQLLVRAAVSAGALLVVLGFTTRALVLAEQPKPEELQLAGPSPDHAAAVAEALLHAALADGSEVSQGCGVEGSPRSVLAIGDSVMLGAKRFLSTPVPEQQLEIDAEVGRTPLLTLSLLKKRKAKGPLPEVVIIHLGNNGPFQAEHFDRMMELLTDVKRVVFVTAKVPRRLGEFNNRNIREGVQRHPRALLLDWQKVSQDHPEFFRTDGLHLRNEGATAYAALLTPYFTQP